MVAVFRCPLTQDRILACSSGYVWGSLLGQGTPEIGPPRVFPLEADRRLPRSYSAILSAVWNRVCVTFCLARIRGSGYELRSSLVLRYREINARPRLFAADLSFFPILSESAARGSSRLSAPFSCSRAMLLSLLTIPPKALTPQPPFNRSSAPISWCCMFTLHTSAAPW